MKKLFKSLLLLAIISTIPITCITAMENNSEVVTFEQETPDIPKIADEPLPTEDAQNNPILVVDTVEYEYIGKMSIISVFAVVLTVIFAVLTIVEKNKSGKIRNLIIFKLLNIIICIATVALFFLTGGLQPNLSIFDTYTLAFVALCVVSGMVMSLQSKIIKRGK
ncbi:MAG: hypothetical protein ACK5KQ_02955 [Anaerorhabdus sp.]